MKKKSTSQSAFFNLRVLIGLFIALAGVFLALVGFGAFSNVFAQAQGQKPTQEQIGLTTVFHALHSDLSRPLREFASAWPPVAKGEEREANLNPKIPHQHVDGPDPVVQDSFWSRLVNVPSVPGPVLTWAGIPFPGVACNCAPPDTNGQVGKTQYVQTVNIRHPGLGQAYGRIGVWPRCHWLTLEWLWRRLREWQWRSGSEL